jgi:ABC-type transporter Mla MlaB component
LDSECVISKTQADTEKLRSLFSGKIGKIELDLHSVREMDTAYFQLLLSLKATADQHNIHLIFQGNCDQIHRIGELYGIGVDTWQKP